MHNKPLISVIVNTYDTAQDVKKCLDTLLLQIYENLEIICIDNELSSEVTELLYSYKEKDCRVDILHRKNLNTTMPWNMGLEAAKGEFIHFINTNCWVLLDLYKVLTDIEEDADIYMFNAALYSEDTIDIPYYELFNDDDIKHKSENNLYSYRDLEHILTSNQRVFNKIYKKSFLDAGNILFFEPNNYCEHLFNLRTIFSSKAIYINPEVYVRSREQLVRQGSGTDRVFDIFGTVNLIERYMMREDIFRDYVFDIFNYVCNSLDSYYAYCPEELKQEYFNRMRAALVQRYNSMPPQVQEVFKNIKEANFLLFSTYDEYKKSKITKI